jgi:4-hydroxyphenylpyruvate dioxygenase
VLSYGDTIHTFVQRDQFKGNFLPGYQAIETEDPINEIAGKLTLGYIDHIVGNHSVGGMETSVQWYEKILSFHRFWSVDDSIINTEYRYYYF